MSSDMGHRISRVTTGSGDQGSTSLAGGERVSKTDPRVEALGAVDELNSHLGLLRTQIADAQLSELLGSLQQDLFDLGAQLAGGSGPGADVERITQWTAERNAELPPLVEFVLPGGNPEASQCHIARTVCRRAERRVAATDAVEAMVYLNRLSDLLFVLARMLARQQQESEEQWEPAR